MYRSTLFKKNLYLFILGIIIWSWDTNNKKEYLVPVRVYRVTFGDKLINLQAMPILSSVSEYGNKLIAIIF